MQPKPNATTPATPQYLTSSLQPACRSSVQTSPARRPPRPYRWYELSTRRVRSGWAVADVSTGEFSTTSPTRTLDIGQLSGPSQPCAPGHTDADVVGGHTPRATSVATPTAAAQYGTLARRPPETRPLPPPSRGRRHQPDFADVDRTGDEPRGGHGEGQTVGDPRRSDVLGDGDQHPGGERSCDLR
jgi:hypothetical protein